MRALVPLLLLAGCAGNDWDWEDTFNPNKPPDQKDLPPDYDDPEPPPAQDCKWPLGSYALANVSCGGNQYLDWTSTYEATTMVVSHNRNRGCDVRVTFQDATCKEVVQFWVDPDDKPEDPSKVILDFRDNPNDDQPYGVVECTPFECSWNQEHVCRLNDHNGDMTVAVNQSDPSMLVFDHFMTWAAPDCNNTLQLAFAKE